MLEKAFRSKRVVQRLRRGKLGAAFDDLVAYLVRRGHPTSTIQLYVQAVEHFDGWLRRTRRKANEVDQALVDKFVRRHLPRCKCPPPCGTTVHQIRTSLRHLLVVLRHAGHVVDDQVEPGPADKIVHAFTAHLRDVRGVAVATCRSTARFAREFLADQFARGRIDFARVRPAAIVEFFAARGGRWSAGTMKVAATSLRRLLRYLQMVGSVADARLVHAIPQMAGWKLASVPRVLTDGEWRKRKPPLLLHSRASRHPGPPPPPGAPTLARHRGGGPVPGRPTPEGRDPAPADARGNSVHGSRALASLSDAIEGVLGDAGWLSPLSGCAADCASGPGPHRQE
jgi:hypothetical protein